MTYGSRKSLHSALSIGTASGTYAFTEYSVIGLHCVQCRPETITVLYSLDFSVSDPNSFYTDPDPACRAEYLSGSGSRVLMNKNRKNCLLC
jgi:hypothetical protein